MPAILFSDHDKTLKFEQLQGGHVYPAVLGGPPLPWNYITQTREENMEWLSAQNYIENLPENEAGRKIRNVSVYLLIPMRHPLPVTSAIICTLRRWQG